MKSTVTLLQICQQGQAVWAPSRDDEFSRVCGAAVVVLHECCCRPPYFTILRSLGRDMAPLLHHVDCAPTPYCNKPCTRICAVYNMACGAALGILRVHLGSSLVTMMEAVCPCNDVVKVTDKSVTCMTRQSLPVSSITKGIEFAQHPHSW